MTESQVPDVILAEHIVKSFGAVIALRDVSLHLMKGEILGLLGDNGAGKSTLIKILTGFIQPDEGRIFVNGEEVKLRSVIHARSLGIETVYAMGAKEGSRILDLIRNLKATGEVSMIMIAHNYAQVLEICDRVNLLQHGSIALDKRVTDTSLEELNELVMREYRLGATNPQ